MYTSKYIFEDYCILQEYVNILNYVLPVTENLQHKEGNVPLTTESVFMARRDKGFVTFALFLNRHLK